VELIEPVKAPPSSGAFFVCELPLLAGCGY
jgi:hypothetical protein